VFEAKTWRGVDNFIASGWARGRHPSLSRTSSKTTDRSKQTGRICLVAAEQPFRLPPQKVQRGGREESASL